MIKKSFFLIDDQFKYCPAIGANFIDFLMPPLKWRNHLLNWLLVRSDWQKSPPPLPIFILDDHFLGDDDEPFNKVPQGGLWPITWNTLAT